MSKAPGVHRSSMAPLLVALLSACGGGTADTGGPAAALANGDAAPGGRAQALAFTMPTPVAAPAGLTGNVSCGDWFVGEATVDNLEVPPDTTCQLDGTTVRGSIHVHPGAVLLAHQVKVAGSVQGTAAAHVQFSGTASRVTGGLQLEGGGSATVSHLSVGGNLVLNGLSNLVTVRHNQIGGNLQLSQNTGGAELRSNQVRGDVQCTGNLPAPLAADNSGASLEGQCQPTATGSSSAPTTPPLSGNITCVGMTLGAVSLDGATALGSGGSSQVAGSVQVQRGAAATVAGAMQCKDNLPAPTGRGNLAAQQQDQCLGL